MNLADNSHTDILAKPLDLQHLKSSFHHLNIQYQDGLTFNEDLVDQAPNKNITKNGRAYDSINEQYLYLTDLDYKIENETKLSKHDHDSFNAEYSIPHEYMPQTPAFGEQFTGESSIQSHCQYKEKSIYKDEFTFSDNVQNTLSYQTFGNSGLHVHSCDEEIQGQNILMCYTIFEEENSRWEEDFQDRNGN